MEQNRVLINERCCCVLEGILYVPTDLCTSQMVDMSRLCTTEEHKIRPGLSRHLALAIEWLEAVEAVLSSQPNSKQNHQEQVKIDLMRLRLEHDQKWR